MSEARAESTRKRTRRASASATTSSSTQPWQGERTITVDWTRLDEGELETLQTIALPISLGLSQRVIAERLGITPAQVSQRYEAWRQRVWELSQETEGSA